MTELEINSGTIRRAKHQLYCHHHQTNTQLFTGRMPFLMPNQQCRSTEGKSTHEVSKKVQIANI